MRIIFISVLLSSVVLLSACSNPFCAAKVSLGNQFAIVEHDRGHVVIIHCSTSMCCNSGTLVGPSNVVQFAFDENYIIAKSDSSGKSSFWLINKGITLDSDSGSKADRKLFSNVFGPLDSLTFNAELKERNITLKLRPYK